VGEESCGWNDQSRNWNSKEVAINRLELGRRGRGRDTLELDAQAAMNGMIAALSRVALVQVSCVRKAGAHEERERHGQRDARHPTNPRQADTRQFQTNAHLGFTALLASRVKGAYTRRNSGRN
jgi:hypothetical protein